MARLHPRGAELGACSAGPFEDDRLGGVSWHNASAVPKTANVAKADKRVVGFLLLIVVPEIFDTRNAVRLPFASSFYVVDVPPPEVIILAGINRAMVDSGHHELTSLQRTPQCRKRPSSDRCLQGVEPWIQREGPAQISSCAPPFSERISNHAGMVEQFCVLSAEP